MKKAFVVAAFALLTTGCFDSAPNSSDIQLAYNKWVTEFQSEFGSLIRFNRASSIDEQECEKLSGEKAWECSYTITFDNYDVEREKGKIIKTNEGWKYEPLF